MQCYSLLCLHLVFLLFTVEAPAVAAAPDDDSKPSATVVTEQRELNILFVHQNFPGQFAHLAPALAQEGHDVKAFHMRPDTPAHEIWKGVHKYKYNILGKGSTPNIHHWLIDLESKTIRGEACRSFAIKMRDELGYTPDVIIAHPGWGEALFLKDVWPSAKLGMYCEFYYSHIGQDTGFDPEFTYQDEKSCPACRFKIKNAYNHLQDWDLTLSPTNWQASTYPNEFQQNMTVIFDGIDTSTLLPDPNARMEVKVKGEASNDNDKAQTKKAILTKQNSELITFVTRNLEPLRGYHIFMRALPELLKRRPNARIILVGGNGNGYGPGPDSQQYNGATTWKDVFVNEVKPLISLEDWNRIHFLGKVEQTTLHKLMQLSTIHVYLTYPFVLSWSLIEAMSIGCTIVASDTKPVQEVIEDGVTGRLVDFFDSPKLVHEICNLLDDPIERARLGNNARKCAIQHYDLKTVCLPKQLEWVYQLAGMSSGGTDEESEQECEAATATTAT